MCPVGLSSTQWLEEGHSQGKTQGTGGKRHVLMSWSSKSQSANRYSTTIPETKQKQNKQTNKKNSLGGTTTTTGRLPMALLYLGSHWEYPRSSCLNCTSWQETDLELSRNRKVHSFHNSSCSLLVALCLNIGCHMGTRWAPLRPALPTPHSARNNKKNNAQRSTSLQKYK